jgi:hypothetical protein
MSSETKPEYYIEVKREIIPVPDLGKVRFSATLVTYKSVHPKVGTPYDMPLHATVTLYGGTPDELEDKIRILEDAIKAVIRANPKFTASIGEGERVSLG